MSIKQVFSEKKLKSQSKTPKINRVSTPSLDKISFKKLISPNSAKKSQEKLAPMSSIVVKCNEFQEKLIKTRESLLKNIQETLDPVETIHSDRVFHKSNNFIEGKQKIKEKLAKNKYKNSAKLDKIMSVIDFDCKDYIGKKFLTPEDLLNGEAIDFLNLNKRKFGESKKHDLVFREKKKKTKNTVTPSPSIKLGTRKKSLPDIFSQKSAVLGKNEQISNKSIRSFDKSEGKSPSNQYIINEMKKLWPIESEKINEKKRNILKIKIDKLQSIIEEKSNSLPIEEEIIKGVISHTQKFKMGSMVHDHIRSLRKKMSLIA